RMEDRYEEGSEGFAIPGRLEVTRGDEVSVEQRAEEDDTIWGVIGKGPKKKRGRKRVTEVVHIINPRVNPSLDFRPKVQNDDIPGVSRVFVGDPGSGMHLDWPIHSTRTIRVKDAVMIVLTDGHSVVEEHICHSVPQEYTATGVFVVDVRQLPTLPLSNDGLGSWGQPQTTITFYNINGDRVSEDNVNWTMKIIYERYKHPGTEPHCHFYKSIYTGVSPSGESSVMAVICYQWEGQSHPITIHETPKTQPGRQQLDLSQDTGDSWGGYPLFSQSPLDFDAVSRVLLGALHIESRRVSDGVPEAFRETGTFLIDIEKCGGEKILHTAGGGRWGKPSGASRLFRSEPDGHWMRVDKGSSGEGEDDWHVQITSKRYESESYPGFMRKIFLVRERGEELRAAYASLAVVTFYWRTEVKIRPLNSVDEVQRNERKRCRQPQIDSNVDSLSYSELARLTLMREAANYERFGALLSRFETIATRYEQMMQSYREEREEEEEEE
ncbi:hypothetical protein PFISCL1PPCAC_15730, partial [Pristionchus fissidentatus]